MQAQEVYIIDDGADYRLLLQHVFARFLPQYKVRFFAGGNALHEHLLIELKRPDRTRPDLILLDLNMPGLSGYQTLVRLQQSPWKGIPVVMMTNDESNQEIEQCYEAGANSFLIKPIGIEAMKQLMSEICRYWRCLNQLSVEESVERLNHVR